MIWKMNIMQQVIVSRKISQKETVHQKKGWKRKTQCKDCKEEPCQVRHHSRQQSNVRSEVYKSNVEPPDIGVREKNRTSSYPAMSPSQKQATLAMAMLQTKMGHKQSKD